MWGLSREIDRVSRHLARHSRYADEMHGSQMLDLEDAAAPEQAGRGLAQRRAWAPRIRAREAKAGVGHP